MMNISNEYFRFLTELRRNNSREWFKSSQQRYQQQVEGPFLDLLVALAPKLAKCCPFVVCTPTRTGGSMMRIARDTRFSKDKAPYKTGLSAMMLHRDQTRGPGMLGYFLNIGLDETLLGAGVSSPEAEALFHIRTAIAGGKERWELLRPGLQGSALKRVPPGFDPSHRFSDDLKRKSFFRAVHFTKSQVTDASFPEAVIDAATQLKPLLGFFARGMGLSWK